MSFNLGEAFGEFVSECEEITARVAEHLRNLEKKNDDQEILDAIYRDVHTLKGSANLYGFSQLGQLAHAMEAGLEVYRKKLAPFSPSSADIYFQSVDLVDQLVKAIAESQAEPDMAEPLGELIPLLIDATVSALSGDYRLNDVKSAAADSVEHLSTEITKIKNETSVKYHEPEQTPQQKIERTYEVNSEPQEAQQGKGSMENTSDSNNQNNMSSTDLSQTIRVQVSRLDKLMNLIGEMVLVRNQVLQFTKNSEDSEFLKLGKRLDLVTSEMQGEVMQTRMQPIGTVLEKFHRVVRDLNKDLGKKINLLLVGSETEVDKSLLESVKDPLTHLIRNACDHGLETPEERRESGKKETGTVTVKSFHEGGQIIIEISDDGRGLDRERILTKAIERNLITQADSGKLTDKDIYNFIFEPGFSTSKSVTTVSGRGVGMDVVRTNIEKIGGNIELSTTPRQGTTVRLRIPLTLAIVPAMVVRAGESRFAIPQVKLVELVRAQSDIQEDDSQRNQIEYLQGSPMFRMRGHLLPLVSLKKVLGLSQAQENLSEVTNIVILNADGTLFGLIVDEIQDTTDIVVKPITKFLKSLEVYSGATIVGDGSVVLIVDVGGIAKRAELKNDAKAIEKAEEALAHVKNPDSQEFLLFKTAASARHAMALCLVQRLEEFDRKHVEFAGQQPVIRYRNSILPLIFLDQFLQYKQPNKEQLPDKISVVVVNKYSRNFGLVVDEILDVVTTETAMDDLIKDRPGIIGSLLHQEEVIVMIDALEVIDIEFKKMNQMIGNGKAIDRSEAEQRKKYQGVHILYAEDTAFFRRQVVKSLEGKGIKVTAVNDGREALNKLEAGEKFNLVLSDIEMPNMTGFELASQVRSQEKLKNIPLIALTTRFKNSDQEEGKRVGFNLYLEKFNSDQVMDGIDRLLGFERKSA